MSERPVLVYSGLPALKSLPGALWTLEGHRRFIVWDPAEFNHKGHQIKVPRRCDDPLYWASTRKPTTWGSWQDVLMAQTRLPGLRAGYVLTEDNRHVFLDLDNCRDAATGALTQWATLILDGCPGAYVEITPSGTGLRVVGTMPEGSAPVLAAVPAHLLPSGPPPPPPGPRPPGVKAVQVEVYFNTPRYVTVTGWQLRGQDEPEIIGLADISNVALQIAALAPPRAERVRNPVAELSDPDLWNCVAAIPNPPPDKLDTWDTFNTVGMAIFAASGGSDVGLTAFIYWSAKNPKHDETECRDRWDHWLHSSPPDNLSGGSLVHEAQAEAARRGTTFQQPSRMMPAGGFPPLTDEQLAGFDHPETPAADGDFLPPFEPTLVIPPFATVPVGPPVPAPKLPFDLLSPRGLVARYGDRPRFIMDDVLTRGTTVLITGLPGAGKSPLLQDWIVRGAMGFPWRGHAMEKIRSVYVAAESARQTTMNLAHFAAGVLEEANGMRPGDVSMEDGLDQIESMILAIDNALTLEADVDRLIATLRGAVAEGGPWTGQTIDLVALDTLRAMSSGSVSSDEDMQLVQAAIAKIREAFPDIVVVVLHHAAKGSPMLSSGSNRLDAMAETILAMTMAKPGATASQEEALQRSEQWGPGPDGWRYAAFRLIMGRNKTWEMIAPVSCWMAVQGSAVRFCYDEQNTVIATAARAALSQGQGVFPDSRDGVKKPPRTTPVPTPIATHDVDTAAFASCGAPATAVAPAHAANGGAEAVRILLGQFVQASGRPRTAAIEAWLMAQTIEAPETRKAAGVGLPERARRARVLDRLREMRDEYKTIGSEGAKGAEVWFALPS